MAYHLKNASGCLNKPDHLFLKEVRIEHPERGTYTRYLVHKSSRYHMRKIKKIERIIAEYSKDDITRSCGQRAENLFVKALSRRGIIILEEKVREFQGKKWEETGHDLDYIFMCQKGKVFGAEIKNTLGYIDKTEMTIKLKMCEYFGVIPLFILRYAPKTYNYEVINKGGYVMIFEKQIYYSSQAELVRKMNNELGLPVDCPRAIPEGIIERFMKWYDEKL